MHSPTPPSEGGPPPGAVTEATLDAALRAVWPGLRAYVLSMLGPSRRYCDEVLQETALHVWERRAELPGVRNFDAWVFRAAYFKTLSLRRDLARRKELCLGEELFERMAGEEPEDRALTEARLRALTECTASLSESERGLLDWRYRENRSLVEAASFFSLSVNTIHQRISRLRRALRHCVEGKLAPEGSL